ncbi:MAG: Clp protease ClpP [Flavobacterium sp.]|uniref:Clp protease ClpP n=1 Tax=Flavobacterium sp. TaxID=239 RepID=UPI0012061639|nr:Clp protease ClpP [Flavobacterium sp.]RZJ67700.1 MAG: Clp protease ClpP [Flavobacterium sp.]
MIGKIYITDVIGQDTTLVDIVRQVKSQKDATEFVAVIDSVGGYVNEGFAIFDFLKGLKVPVHTYAKKAYSIASVIYMAGERRIVDENATDVLMIHLPWADIFMRGTYDELIEGAEDLRQAEEDLIKFYSSNLDIDQDTIKNLLAKETFLNSNEAVDFGLATETKAVATAMAKLTNNKEKEEKSLMKNLIDATNKRLDSLAKFVGLKAEMILQDGNGTELVFSDLDSGDTPTVGDLAKVDGKDAEGDFVMRDGSTYKFEAGELKEIVPSDSDEDSTGDSTDDVDATLNDSKAETVKQLCKWSMEVDNTTFAEGDIVTYTYEAVSYPLCAGEYELSDGSSFVTDADGKIVKILDKTTGDDDASTDDTTTNPAPSDNADANIETVERLLDIIEANARKMVEIEAKYQALAKSVGSNYEPSAPKNVSSQTIKADSEDKPKFSISRKSTKK